MIGFLIGLIAGGFIGVCAMALMCAASREDDRIERNYSQKEL